MAGRHVDPELVQTRDDLARALTELRSEAGLTVRDLARQLDAPVATLGDYFAGRHLPGTRQLHLYESVLTACGVQDPDLREQWVAALARVRRATDGRAAKGRAPFRGLDAFREVDADLFFGRHAAVRELLERLREAGDESGRRGAVAVVGPSGCGKTSLFMAGLLPAVRAGRLDDQVHPASWEMVATTPDQLAEDPGRREEPERPRLIVVDQVETALTLPTAPRAELVARIGALQATSLVVLGLRADFYQAAVAEPTLLPALRNQLIVAPMTADELREAVVGPIREVGAGIEDGLVDLILAELAPGTPPGFAHEPGALPLLSYALLATWERAGHNQLTIADYRAVGGLRGAVRQAADQLYDSLSEPEQDLARRMFARLVRLDDDGPPTRRRAGRDELLTARGEDGGGEAAQVLERFVAARLLTADAQTIQISHEALLGAWPRLAEWVSSDRDWLRLHHQIADAAEAWDGAGRDESLLWQGARLDAAVELAAAPGRDRDLNRGEGEFLTASTAYRTAQERARRRRTRRTRQLLAVIAVLAIAASVLAGVASNARAKAVLERDQALSRQVAVEAQQLQPTDPSLAAQLAVAAYRISPTIQARSTLIDATAGEIPTRLLGPVGPEFVALSADGRILAVAQSGNDTVALYRRSSGTPVKVATMRVGPASAQDYAVAVSPNGSLLAVGGTTDAVVLWNIADPAHPARLATLGGLSSTVYALTFAPDGQQLAAADADGTVHRWTLGNPHQPSAQPVLEAPGDGAVKAVAYSPGGTWLAVGGTGTVAVWDVATADPVPVLAPGVGSTDFQSVAFSPDGTELVAGSGNNEIVQVWDVGPAGQLTPAHSPLSGATSEVNSTVFSPEGSILADATAGGTVRLYDTRTWATIATFGNPDPVTGLAFTPGGHALVSADSGGVTRIWSLPAPGTYTEPGNVYALRYGPRGRYLVAGSAGSDGGVTVWGGTDPLRLTRLVNLPLPAEFGAAAGVVTVSPNGRLLAVGNAQAQIQLFDMADIRHPVPVGPPLLGSKPFIEQLGFSPNGRLLVAADDSGQVRGWDVRDPAHPVPLQTIRGAKGQVLGFAFSRNGRILATASSDKKVRVYDVADPARPRLLATVGGFASYVYDATITPNGHTLIAGSADGTIRLWDITDPAHPRLLDRLTGPSGYVFQVTVSPDGRTLAAASTAHAVWLWDIVDPAHPQLLTTLGAAKNQVFTVRFNPDNRVLAASGSDDTVHLWDYRAGDAARQVCALAGDGITRAEWSSYVQGATYRPPCR